MAMRERERERECVCVCVCACVREGDRRACGLLGSRARTQAD